MVTMILKKEKTCEADAPVSVTGRAISVLELDNLEDAQNWKITHVNVISWLLWKCEDFSLLTFLLSGRSWLCFSAWFSWSWLKLRWLNIVVIILKGIRKLTRHWSQWNWWWWQFLGDLIFSPEQMPRVGAGPIGWTALPFLKQTCFEISKSQSHQTNVWHLQIHHWGQATQAPFIFLQSSVEMSLLNPSSNAFCSETWYIFKSVRKEKWGSAFWRLAPTMVALDSDFLGAVKPHFLM